MGLYMASARKSNRPGVQLGIFPACTPGRLLFRAKAMYRPIHSTPVLTGVASAVAYVAVVNAHAPLHVARPARLADHERDGLNAAQAPWAPQTVGNYRDQGIPRLVGGRLDQSPGAPFRPGVMAAAVLRLAGTGDRGHALISRRSFA